MQANEQLGFKPDARTYARCKPMLAQFDVKSLRLMTNNPRKIDAMEALGMRWPSACRCWSTATPSTSTT